MTKQINWFEKNTWYMHVIAVLLFLMITIMYFSPALSGDTIVTHDQSSFLGMTGEGAKNEYHPGKLWKTNMFSGLPEFALGGGTVNPAINVPNFRTYMDSILPYPINMFFWAALGFYVLACALKTKKILGILIGLCYAFATYNVIIISPFAGHYTKMATIALMPFMISGLIFIWQKKYLSGILLFSASTIAAFQFAHLQIIYYALIVLFAFALYFVVNDIKEKKWAILFRHGFLIVILLALAYLVNSGITSVLSEYSKASTRGGSALPDINITDHTIKQVTPSNGHDSAYAMSYSMRISEPLVLMMANAFGGGDVTQWKEDGPVMNYAQEHLQEVQQTGIMGVTSAYWGGIGSTVGPPYVGIVLVFLALVALVVVHHKIKWYILGTIVLSIFLSWGGYFWNFNEFVWKYLPFYNKFRAPSMIMVIPQLLIPVLAILGLNEFAKKDLNPTFYIKKILYTAGGFLLFLLIMYVGLNFLSPNDEQSLRYIKNNITAEQGQSFYKGFFDAVVKERQQIYLSNLWQCVWMVGISVALIALVIYKKMKYIYAFLIIGVIAFTDLIKEDLNFVNKETFTDSSQTLAPQLQKTPINESLLQDTSYYRVTDLRRTVSIFNDSYMAYYHNMTGGYSPAKLSIYQDLISYQLSRNNMKIYNMLNTKYFVFTGQDGKEQITINPDNLGTCWLVKNIKYVPNALQEMKALDSFSAQTAIVNEQDKSRITTPQYNPINDSIRFVAMRNDSIWYRYHATAPQFAVFSEIFYVNQGWNAYFNGKKLPVIKTNYALRGLSLPPGSGDVLFVFKPQILDTAAKNITIGAIILWIIWLGVIGFAFYTYRKNKKIRNHKIDA